ncbi:PREDICTED: cytochrome b5-like [Nicrophorus vespilloides]|uniref:Cytochrome b5 n=1 Tax=Nicrophorus vespilloides TaxID=110193 RepID=A0ABM1N7T8_NICVS|nr:PREDICTED: cytochrome b5-like [Nicrophorus vespilloides]
MEINVKYFKFEEISKRNGKNGNKTWIVVKDIVYDVTPYLLEHPGGSELITDWGGKEATKPFEEGGHSSYAKSILVKYKIGELHPNERGLKDEPVGLESGSSNGPCCFIRLLTCGFCR